VRHRQKGVEVIAPGEALGESDLIPPKEGYELYRHKNAETMKTRNWRGLYWARRNEKGDYEIRTVPSSEGERSAPGGVFPKEGFEEHYERLER
jgi:hypothetical protein